MSTAMADEAVGETMLSAELWLSFGSLVRAYAAAASVNSDLAPEVAAAAAAVSIAAGSARLEMRFDPQTGAGNWQLLRDDNVKSQGRLAVLPEGRMAIDGKILDLDHAAIDLVAFVINAAVAGTEP